MHTLSSSVCRAWLIRNAGAAFETFPLVFESIKAAPRAPAPGVWAAKYRDVGRPSGVITLRGDHEQRSSRKCLSESKFGQIAPSPPIVVGWLKVSNLRKPNTWSYMRVDGSGVLQIIMFSETASSTSCKNFFCSGSVGIWRSFCHKRIFTLGWTEITSKTTLIISMISTYDYMEPIFSDAKIYPPSQQT